MGVSGDSSISSSYLAKKASAKKAVNLLAQRAATQTFVVQQQAVQSKVFLQRLIDEDERRRRLGGGGGGGGFRKIQQFLPSLAVMNYKADFARSQFFAGLNSPSVVLQNIAAAAVKVFSPIIRPVIQIFTNLQNGIANFAGNLASQLARLPNNALKMAKSMAQGFAHLAQAAANALSNFRWFKNILGIDEEKSLENNDYGDEDKLGLLDKIKMFFTDRKNNHEDDNKRSILSHIENMADQVIGFFKFKT